MLCGGPGLRLWPASGVDRPKPFLRLTGPESLFQATIRRVLPCSDAPPLVVAASASAQAVRSELAAVGSRAELLLEPVGRDTAPAMAAAALKLMSQAPDAVIAFVPSDHHVGDDAAFRLALAGAAEQASMGRLVLFGMRPDRPSSAYGHIRPTASGDQASPVAAFHEKPDVATAGELTAQGWLWNGGVLVARARDLVEEVQRLAPEVAAAARAAVGAGEVLGPAFEAAPRISMDYAVLEKTDRAWVLPVDFGWSDLGAWDAVAEATPAGLQRAAVVDGGRVWVRAPEAVKVAVVGLSDVLVVMEGDRLLICARDAAQSVRRAAQAAEDDQA